MGKKLWFRAESFKARDLYDLATVIELDPEALREIAPLVREKGPLILDLAASKGDVMREEFEALERYGADRSFERCLEVVRGHLRKN